MKIGLINGSPKTKGSASASVLKRLKDLLGNTHEIAEIHCRTAQLSNIDLEQMAECSTLVFAFPLYVDSIPSHLVSCLYQMESFFKSKPAKITIYSVVNCGFYEGHQNAIALEIVKNWCEKTMLTWGQGIGIGGGGMLPMLENIPDGKGPTKNFSEALHTFASNISTGSRAENIYVSPNFPRFAYKLAAEMGWRQQIKANGLRRKDLSMRR